MHIFPFAGKTWCRNVNERVSSFNMFIFVKNQISVQTIYYCVSFARKWNMLMIF